MWNINPDKLFKMFTHMCDKHRGEMHSAYLDWEIVEVTHPKYDSKIQQLVPLVVIDFK